MRKLAPCLILSLAIAGCTPAPAATPTGVAATPVATEPASAATPAAVAPTPTAAPVTVTGSFPVGALPAVRRAYGLLQAPEVTLDDLGKLSVTVDGQPLGTGGHAFSDVRIVNGQVHFTLTLKTPPAAGQTLQMANAARTFSLMVRMEGVAAPTLDSRSTAVALYRLEQAKRGQPTDAPLPAKLIDRLTAEVEKRLAVPGDRPLDAALATMVGAMAEMNGRDDTAEFNNRTGTSSGGSGGSSGPAPLVPSPAKVSLTRLGATAEVQVTGAASYEATSGDDAVATVAPVADTADRFTVTAVAVGTTTLTLKAPDGRTVSLDVTVTTTSVTIQ
jgi:hypothetical protein